MGLPIIKQLFTWGARWFSGFLFDLAKDQGALYDIAAKKAANRQEFDNTFILAELKSGVQLTDQEKEDEIRKLEAAARTMHFIDQRVRA